MKKSLVVLLAVFAFGERRLKAVFFCADQPGKRFR
jgi:hypothetical protein